MEALAPVTLDPLAIALRFAAALALGVLLGLERERVKAEASFAGVRTFGLLALAGGVAAFLESPSPCHGSRWRSSLPSRAS